MNRKTMLLVGIVCILIGCCIFMAIYKKSTREDGMQEAVAEEEGRLRIRNAVGVTDHVFDTVSISQSSTMEMHGHEGVDRMWLVVNVADAGAWHDLRDTDKKGLMQGLINTSRLQGDRDFGGVMIRADGGVSVRGWWQKDRGYVTVQEDQ